MKRIAFIIIFSLLSSLIFSDISFVGPDINGRNEVLFSVRTDIPGKDSAKTLLRKNLDTLTIEQLTCYPEALESLLGGSLLQVRNRFGTSRYDSRTDSFSWIDNANSFYSGGIPKFGELSPVSASPDGRWVVSIEPISPAWGRLVLYDVKKDIRCLISNKIERGEVPVSWAPDSSVLLYSLDSTLYFSRPEAFFSSIRLEEKYTVLGPGTIRNVSWFSSSRFLYVQGKSVYRIQSAELFARSFYTPLIGIGELAGKIPAVFNSSEDHFCSSPDGLSVLYASDCRNVYFCSLSGDDYVLPAGANLLPYVQLPGNTAEVRFVWNSQSKPTVFTSAVEDGKKIVRAWKLESVRNNTIFTPLSIPQNASALVPSPEGNFIAFITEQGLLVYDSINWKLMSSWKDERVISAAWADEYSLYVGGNETVRKWNFRLGSSSLLFVSSVSSYGWDEQGSQILVDTSSLGRMQYLKGMKWESAQGARLRPASGTNSRWRLYLDSSSGYYENMLFVRSAVTPGGTTPILPEPSIKLDNISTPIRATASGSSEGVFSHGQRTGYRQVALVFDALDTLEGLPKILHLLNKYNIKATFFVNGECIRRHPAAVNEIVKAGHQTASLFFTTWDLSGMEYRIDEDFIIRGLSRTEDDFYNATGQELTLLWHPPYYVMSPLILEAGKKAGYTYISPDVSVLDWVTKDHERLMPGLYSQAADLVDSIISQKKPGSIIPVRVGKVSGPRSDFLYEKIDLLINALIEAGYSIVTVDTLQKNMQ